jgi:hypothetical protein
MKNWGNIIKRTAFLLMIAPLLLLAYSDGDFDGVADEHDLCPNSTMLDIVDKTGCVVEKLEIPPENQYHVDMVVGANYTKMAKTDDKRLNESFQMDYYYKNFTLQLQTANYEEGGMGDTTLGFHYRFRPLSKLSLNLGASLIFPTYDSELENNNMDYKISSSLSYQLNKVSLFGGVSYRVVNDDDINGSNYTITYQNSQNFYVGLGSYLFPKLYSSFIYSDGSSIYERGEHLQNISLYNHYLINANWFSRFGYTQGLNDSSSDQFYLSIGYYF